MELRTGVNSINIQRVVFVVNKPTLVLKKKKFCRKIWVIYNIMTYPGKEIHSQMKFPYPLLDIPLHPSEEEDCCNSLCESLCFLHTTLHRQTSLSSLTTGHWPDQLGRKEYCHPFVLTLIYIITSFIVVKCVAVYRHVHWYMIRNPQRSIAAKINNGTSHPYKNNNQELIALTFPSTLQYFHKYITKRENRLSSGKLI